LFLSVILPAALPFIVAGLRTGISVAFVVLVAAEMTGADAGLGYRIEQSHLVFRADRMIVGIATLGILGALSDRVFDRVASRFLFWAK
jgi:ABC-type nitrate/sulfonate/bicarbonate transport system permease component